MRRLVLLAALLAIPSACAHNSKPTPSVRTTQVRNLDEFEAAINRFVLLRPDDPQRERARAQLSAFLVGYVDAALADEDVEEAREALSWAMRSFVPAELRKAAPDPRLAAAAHRVYRASAKEGAEKPALLALAIVQRFGSDKQRQSAELQWERLEDWLVRGGPMSDDPLMRHEELERALEDVAADFPSPFVVERLADLYVARYEVARRAGTQGQGDIASTKRMEITGYLLLRLYLRADDDKGAVASLDRVELDPAVKKLGEIVADALQPRRNARTLLSLAEQFIPDPGPDSSLPFVRQGWAIADNLARRALSRHERDPYVHLLRARTLEEAGLYEASIHHLRRALDLKEDVFEAWQRLVVLEHHRLTRMAEADPVAAAEHLDVLEDIHRRVVKLWRDRPIQPGLPQAYAVVAEGLYQAGRIDRAQQLLERSVAIEASPVALDLLGTIAFKRRDLATARTRYQALADLPYDTVAHQLQWEARARRHLGEIALRESDTRASMKHFRDALRQTNELLARMGPDAQPRAELLVDRGKVLFFLGEIKLAMTDFEHAQRLAPDRPQVFADPLLHLVAHGYYAEAVQIFRRAMDQGQISDGLKLYFALWLNELALRQDRAPEPEVLAFLDAYAGDGRGENLARHAQNRLPYAQLLERARDPGERAEAYFYEGLRRWRGGEAKAGRKLLQQVLDTDMMGFFEYDMALAYLAWGDVPRAARPALSESGRRTAVAR